MNIYFAFIVSYQRFFGSIECESLTFGAFTEFGDIVQTKHHIL